MRYPFRSLAPRQQSRLLLNFFLPTLVVGVVIGILGANLKTDVAPRGGLDLQQARTTYDAAAIVGSWSEKRLLPMATLTVGIDYLLIVLYATTLSLGCAWGTQMLTSRTGEWIGATMAWLCWVAGLCDCVENFALLRMISGDIVQLWVDTARVASTVKFGIIGVAVLFIATAYALKKWSEAVPHVFGRV